MIPAVPTTGVQGIRFRSRLEARWAAWLSFCGWPFAYEPDLNLRGWIPDFAITAGGGLFVEVKPAITLAGLVEHRARIEGSGVVAQVWLVGAAFALAKGPQPVLGWRGFAGGDTLGGKTVWHWQPAYLEELKLLVDQPSPLDFKNAQRFWIAAGNDHQWRAR